MYLLSQGLSVRDLAINTESSILVVDQMVWNYWWLCPMRELIMDHGTEFCGNRIQEAGNPNSRFKKHLEELGIKPIMARAKASSDQREARKVVRYL